MLDATTLAEQRAIFDAELAPIFDRAFVRWLTSQPASPVRAGHSRARFERWPGTTGWTVLKAQLKKLACDFDLKDNYFAVQAFGRGYAANDPAGAGPLPRYLPGGRYDGADAADRVDVRHVNFTVSCAISLPLRRIATYCSMRDWMDDDQLNALWAQITRTAAGARVCSARRADRASCWTGCRRGDGPVGVSGAGVA